MFGSLGQLTHSHLNLAELLISCLVARVGSGGQCWLHTEKPSGQCRVGKWKSSFSSRPGWPHPRKTLFTHSSTRRRPPRGRGPFSFAPRTRARAAAARPGRTCPLRRSMVRGPAGGVGAAVGSSGPPLRPLFTCPPRDSWLRCGSGSAAPRRVAAGS